MRCLLLPAASAMLLLATGCDRLSTSQESRAAGPTLAHRAPDPDNATQLAARLCSSPATYERLKIAAFRQAAHVRGTDSAPFDKLAAYATVRVEEPLVVAGDRAPRLVRCSGRMAVDLPPGTAAINGARSLASDIAFVGQQAADGSGLVWTLSAAEPIVYPLATLRRITGEEFLPPPVVPVSVTTPEAPAPAPPAPAPAVQPAPAPALAPPPKPVPQPVRPQSVKPPLAPPRPLAIEPPASAPRAPPPAAALRPQAAPVPKAAPVPNAAAKRPAVAPPRIERPAIRHPVRVAKVSAKPLPRPRNPVKPSAKPRREQAHPTKVHATKLHAARRLQEPPSSARKKPAVTRRTAPQPRPAAKRHAVAKPHVAPTAHVRTKPRVPIRPHPALAPRRTLAEHRKSVPTPRVTVRPKPPRHRPLHRESPSRSFDNQPDPFYPDPPQRSPDSDDR